MVKILLRIERFYYEGVFKEDKELSAVTSQDLRSYLFMQKRKSSSEKGAKKMNHKQDCLI